MVEMDLLIPQIFKKKPKTASVNTVGRSSKGLKTRSRQWPNLQLWQAHLDNLTSDRTVLLFDRDRDPNASSYDLVLKLWC